MQITHVFVLYDCIDLNRLVIWYQLCVCVYNVRMHTIMYLLLIYRVQLKTNYFIELQSLY